MVARALVTLGLVGLLTGCSTLLPERVELFQQKVEEAPAPTAADKEAQRQAAALAAVRAQDTLIEAVRADAPETVIEPARDTATLTAVVSKSVGAPQTPSDTNVMRVVQRLERSLGDLQVRMDRFIEKNREQAGKKIEGTGLLQVPYFLWIGLVGVFVLVLVVVVSVGVSVLRVMAGSNPILGAAGAVVRLTANAAQRGFLQVVKGGELFKKELQKVVEDPKLRDEILKTFRQSQQSVQDTDIQQVIKELS